MSYNPLHFVPKIKLSEAADHKRSAERVVNHKRHEGFPYRSALEELKKHFGGLLNKAALMHRFTWAEAEGPPDFRGLTCSG